MKTKVRLAARIDLPDEDSLAKAGWDIEKTATPDPKDKSEKFLAEDGKKASDEPTDAKVVADQKEPVTSGKKKSERTIRREEIIESDGPSNSKEDDDEERKEESEVSNDPFGSSSNNVLAAMKLAEIEQELGLDADWNGADKFERVASLEGLGSEILSERIRTLSQVKQAGLSKPKVAKKTASLPRLNAGRGSKTASQEATVAPDYAIFGS